MTHQSAARLAVSQPSLALRPRVHRSPAGFAGRVAAHRGAVQLGIRRVHGFESPRQLAVDAGALHPLSEGSGRGGGGAREAPRRQVAQSLEG